MTRASFHSPLGKRAIDVITLPAFATGGQVTGFREGVPFTDTVAANTAYKILDKDTARRTICILATGAGDAEYGFHANLAPGNGWLCLGGGGGFEEDFGHIYEVYAVSAAGTTVRIMRG
jgi:hypothetical protein